MIVVSNMMKADMVGMQGGEKTMFTLEGDVYKKVGVAGMGVFGASGLKRGL